MAQIFELKLGYPLANAPARSKDQWAEALILNAKRINDKRLLSVPTSGEFQEKIADPSSTGYVERFTTIATNHRTGKTQQMMQDNQRTNLLRSFDKWSQKLNTAFETVGTVIAKRFVDAVNAAKNLFGAGAGVRTLRATGTRLEGIGAVVIAPYWLTEHKKAAASIRPGIDQVVNGGPHNVVINGVQDAFVSLLTQVLTFSMIQAEKSAMDPAVLTELNTRINHIVQTMVDPGLGLTPFATGGLSHVDIVNDPVRGEILSVAVNQI
jgi:hypothetical protein